MIDLERMTTIYVADEDRISITANAKTGGTVRVWLTRRIADRLVPALVKVVQPQHEDPAYAEIIDEIAQVRAEQRHEPQAPVQTASPDHEWLVRKIDLQLPKGGAAMILSGAEGQCARVIFNQELLRQWLAILRRVYQGADWALTQWPVSMRGASPSKRPPAVLH